MNDENSCILCAKSENEVDLIEIETNLMEFSGETVEFSELFEEIFELKINTGLICYECQENLSQFYLFKLNTKLQVQNLKYPKSQRKEIVRKLEAYLNDVETDEELLIITFGECFTVVPDSKRKTVDGFQQVYAENVLENDKSEFKIIKCESINPKTPESPLKSSDDHDSSQNFKKNDDDINELHEKNPKYEEDYYMIVEAEEEAYDTDYIVDETDENLNDAPVSKHMRNTREQREWANQTTKSSYSIEKNEDGSEIPTWNCSICGKSYKSGQAMRLHLLAKHLDDEEEKNISVEVKQWLRKLNREQRKQVETEEGNKFEWNCKFCKFACYSSQTFRNHLLENHQENSEETESLSVTSETVEKLKPLKETVKSSRPRKSRNSSSEWICKICHFQFSAQRNFDAHMRLHETLDSVSPYIELFKCEQCKMFFRNVDDLTSHVEGHAEGISMLLHADGIALQKTILFERLPIPEEVHEDHETCGHCGMKISGEITCKSHLLIHHMNPIICPKDDRKFTSMQPFVCHLQKAHADMLPESLRCTHCSESFENVYDRLAHMKVCSHKKFDCDHCDKKFSTKNQLNNHLKREKGLTRCRCALCGKSFKAKDDLKIHMRSHTKEKAFKCSLCDKTYTTASARASHMEMHKDTVIQCEICAVKFIARRNYMVHYKRYHDEIYRQKILQQHTCGICSKQFLRKDRLKEHLAKAHGNRKS